MCPRGHYLRDVRTQFFEISNKRGEDYAQAFWVDVPNPGICACYELHGGGLLNLLWIGVGETLPSERIAAEELLPAATGSLLTRDFYAHRKINRCFLRLEVFRYGQPWVSRRKKVTRTLPAYRI